MTINPTPLDWFAPQGVMEFEKSKNLLMDRVYTKVIEQGETATFNVVGTSDLIATTRNLNGLKPAQQISRAQKTATLVENNVLVQHTDFDLFGSQNGPREAMNNCVAALHRKIDNVILTALAGATTNTLTGVASTEMVVNAIVKLQESKAGGGVDNVTAIVSPSFYGQLMLLESFNNSQYVDMTPYTSTTQMEARKWMGCTFIVDPEITGVGTASAKAFIFHRNAIGYVHNSNALRFFADYNKEHSYWYTGADIYHAAVLLQETGVVEITHDDTQLS